MKYLIALALILSCLAIAKNDKWIKLDGASVKCIQQQVDKEKVKVKHGHVWCETCTAQELDDLQDIVNSCKS